MKTFYYITAWLLLGLVGSGMLFPHFQDSYPCIAYEKRRFSHAFSVFMMVGGPIYAVEAFFFTGYASSGWSLNISRTVAPRRFTGEWCEQDFKAGRVQP